MKSFILFLLLVTTTGVYSQNEFAARAFYKDLQKIYADGQTGFATYKGKKLKSPFEEIVDEYTITLLLPLADSGKIVLPVNGNPYAVFYFEPDKVRLRVDQRGADLRDALVTAFGKPLFARTETTMVDNRALTNTYCFTDANESRNANALFRISIYYNNNKYYLSLEIRGKNP
jgi:hypothetical protein